MKALVLVDLQNDFLPGGTLAVPEGDRVLLLANKLQQCFELVVATQDWHPANHGSFAANHADRKPGEFVELSGLQQILWPVHCVQETRGAAFAEALETTRIAQVIRKGTDPEIDSYSGFFDNGQRKATGLDDYLKQRQVTELFLLGLATDYCVKFTALDACRLGFSTTLVEDACRGVELTAGDVAQAIDEMRNAGVAIASSTDVAAGERR